MKSKLYGVVAATMISTGSASADGLKLDYDPDNARTEQLVRKFEYVLASIERGVVLEAKNVLEEILPHTTHDRRLHGFARIAVTYFQLDKPEKARALLQRVLSSLQGQQNGAIEKIDLTLAFLQAAEHGRADRVMEQIAQSCGPDRSEILREVNIARAALAVHQYEVAVIQAEKVKVLLSSENREQLETFHFSVDALNLDSIAGVQKASW